MTELNTFNALKQEEKAIIHSWNRTALGWSGTADDLFRVGLGRCFYRTEVWFSVVFNLSQK